MNRAGAHLLAIAVVLVAIAIASPVPSHVTDKDVYVKLVQQKVLPGCDDFHCFRVLVPWTLSLFPGADGYGTWRVYAVVCQVAAAWAMRSWVLRMGASRAAAVQVMWLTALGSGSLYTLFDPFTSDPLMHVLVPAVMLLLDRQRLLAATAVSVAGIFAKEMIAVPLAVMGAWRLLEGRVGAAVRHFALLAPVIGTWLVWQAAARAWWRYSTGPTPSADILHGSFLVYWIRNLGPQLVVAATAGAMGALWLLWPAGVWWSSAGVRRFTLAALPALVAWNFLQQPDRAMWNFAFVVMPAVAVVLDRLPVVAGWCLVAGQAVVNLRIGAQLPWTPPLRLSLPVMLVVALIMIAMAARAPRPQLVTAS